MGRGLHAGRKPHWGPRSTDGLRRWADVLVQVEQVGGVVVALDRGQAVVGAPVVRLGAALVVAVHEVDVTAVGGIGLERVVVAPDPGDVAVIVRWVFPHTGDDW